MAEVLRPVISRLHRKFRRWARRWTNVVGDSFNRASQTGLGETDTGHTWRILSGTAGSETSWHLIDGKAGLWLAGVGENFWAVIFTAALEVTVQARITIGTITAPGVGLAFHANDAGTTCRAFTYAGGTEYRTVSCSGNTATTHLSQTGGPTLTTGQSYDFKLVISGSSVKGYVDGVQVISDTWSLPSIANTNHGLYVRDNADHRFDNFRCFPN